MKPIQTIPLGVALSMALAACGQPVAQPSAPAQASGPLLALTLQAPFTGSLKPQGVPTGASGLGAVTSLKVKVTDANGTPVEFDGNNVYQSGGSQAFLTLTPGQQSLKVLLPRGIYSFENIGKANDGSFLAYGASAGVDISAASSLTLPLHALLDQGALSLTLDGDPATVDPDTALTARLKVQSPLVGGARATVPTSDYGAPTYTATQATLLSGSVLGTQVRTTASPTANFRLDVSLQGWVADGAEHARQQTVTASVTKPFPKALPGPGIYENDNAGITYTGSWSVDGNTSFHGGSGMYSSTANDSLSFDFVGTGIAAYAFKYDNEGIVDIYLDGAKVASADLYDPSYTLQSKFYEVAGLPSGKHTLKIVVTGSNNPNASFHYFDFDYLEVQ